MNIRKTIKLNAYEIITRAVEHGIDVGWRRAHKHSDEPSEDILKEKLTQEIMNSLCEVLDFS